MREVNNFTTWIFKILLLVNVFSILSQILYLLFYYFKRYFKKKTFPCKFFIKYFHKMSLDISFSKFYFLLIKSIIYFSSIRVIWIIYLLWRSRHLLLLINISSKSKSWLLYLFVLFILHLLFVGIIIIRNIIYIRIMLMIC